MISNYKNSNEIKTVGVIGAGTMGTGIAQVVSQAGLSVILFDLNSHLLKGAKSQVSLTMEKLISKGKVSAVKAQGTCQRITYVTNIEAMAAADLVVEAIVEQLDIKQQVFQQLESICSPQALLVSNTSAISITAIGSAMRDPRRLAGLHFFNPAPVMKLVEVVKGLATDANVVVTLLSLAKSWGKVAVAAKSSPGFIVNRIARPFYAEGLRLVEEGVAEPARIDALMREAGGFRMGPFELMDLIGHDVNYSVTKSVFEANYIDPRFKPSLLQAELVNAGWMGRKSGRGFYTYDNGKVIKEKVEWDNIRFGGFFNISRIVESVLIKPLIDRMLSAGVTLHSKTTAQVGEIVFANGARLVVTDGRTTLDRALQEDNPYIIQMDLSNDYGTCTALALSTHPDIPEEVWIEVYSFFDFLGIKTCVVKDMPGLVVYRTVAMLINEAADTLHLSIADQQGIDCAMKYGVNYPKGLLAWADELGTSQVARVLENLYFFYHDDRYRLSPALIQRSQLGSTFHARH